MSRLLLASMSLALLLVVGGFRFSANTRTRRYNSRHIGTEISRENAFQNNPENGMQPKLLSVHSISLDTAVLSGSKFGLQKLGFCALLMALAGSRFFGSFNDENGANQSKSQSSKATSTPSLKNAILSFFKSFASIARNLPSKIISSVQNFPAAVMSALGSSSSAKDIKLDDWNVCKLQHRESLFGGRYTRYRFDLENPSSKIPLYIGQEVTWFDFRFFHNYKKVIVLKSLFTSQIVMCSTDSKGRILKEHFFPISSSALRGHFEVLVRRNTGGGAYDKFVRSLDSLEEGDEIAFKGGPYRLNYEGADDPIKFVTVVSAGVGIAPSLQILNGILSDRESTVEDMEVLWINSDNRDFVCEKDVMALEKKYEKKLFVTRVSENKLFEQDFTQKDVVLGAISPYEEGRIAVVCGSDDVIVKVRAFLLSVGYPGQSVLSIST